MHHCSAGGAKVKSEAESKEHLQTTGTSSSPNNDLKFYNDSPLSRGPPAEAYEGGCKAARTPQAEAATPAATAEIELSTRVPESGGGNYASVTVHQQITPHTSSDPVRSPQRPPSGGDTKITVDVVVDFKGIRICDHHHSDKNDSK